MGYFLPLLQPKDWRRHTYTQHKIFVYSRVEWKLVWLLHTLNLYTMNYAPIIYDQPYMPYLGIVLSLDPIPRQNTQIDSNFKARRILANDVSITLAARYAWREEKS